MATVAIVVLSILLVVSNGYFLYWRPQHHRAAFLSALPLLDSESRPDLERAESRLAEALSGGLGGRDSRDARFALAWTRAQLGRFEPARYGDALALLALPERPGAEDPAIADLRLWLIAQQGKHEEVLRLIEQQPALGRRTRNRSLYAAALEHRAVDLWNRRDVDAAVRALDQARQLGAESRVHLRDLVELLLEHGMRAVADRDYETAVKSFDRAEAMSTGGGVQRIEAGLGRLAVRWNKNEPGVLTALAEEFEALRRRAEQRGGDDDAPALRAHVGWWYLVAMLEDWLSRLPPHQGLPPSEHERFLTVVRVVTEADPDLGDVVMMHGMLDYGLAETSEQTALAVGILDRSTRTARGVVLEEVGAIVERRSAEMVARGRAADWSDDAEPAPPPGEEAVYPGVPLDAVFLQAQRVMASRPEVRAAVEALMRTLGHYREDNDSV
jgi:tetratricopeptide (TPR) repeat protein